jgi:hypothetical protein
MDFYFQKPEIDPLPPKKNSKNRHTRVGTWGPSNIDITYPPPPLSLSPPTSDLLIKSPFHLIKNLLENGMDVA